MSAEEPGSITRWIRGLREGRPEAVAAIWDRYYRRVLAVARSRLRVGPYPAVEDGEDVALSAFHGLAAGAARGQFDRLDDRSDLWQVLAAITAKKARDRRRWYRRWKRSGRPPAEASPGPVGPHDPGPLLDRAVGREPVPEAAVMMEDQVRHFLDALDDPVLRRIAERRLEGASNAEIAGELGRAVRTVERKIERIRLIWEARGVADD